MKRNRDCIFCQIANRKIDAAIFWEDENYMALLDNKPSTPGMSLVITKQHFKSDISEIADIDYTNLMLAVKKVIKTLKKGLSVKRVGIAIEGLEVNHAHVKLYPLYGLKSSFVKTVTDDISYWPKYRGFISTKFGPTADAEDLRKLADKLSKVK